RVAQPAADLFKNLPRALGVDLVRHLHRAAEIRSGRGARTPQRVAVRALLARPLLTRAILAFALHGLKLLHHVLCAAAQGFQSLSLLGDGFLSLAFAKRTLCAAHCFAGLA